MIICVLCRDNCLGGMHPLSRWNLSDWIRLDAVLNSFQVAWSLTGNPHLFMVFALAYDSCLIFSSHMILHVNAALGAYFFLQVKSFILDISLIFCSFSHLVCRSARLQLDVQGKSL